MNDAICDDPDFSATEINLLKAGAVYPDRLESSNLKRNHPEWHGQFRDKNKSYEINYMANYIFATKIAKAGGDTSSLTKANGQEQGCYERMIKFVSTSGINGKSWATIIKNETNLDYSSKSAATQKKWRKAFLYGMASHTAADAFAHATYYKDPTTGRMILLSHGDGENDWADDPEQYSARYDCAGYVVLCASVNYQVNSIGDISDFSYTGSYDRPEFYMRNLLHYAAEANDGTYSTEYLIEEFARTNYYLADITK